MYTAGDGSTYTNKHIERNAREEPLPTYVVIMELFKFYLALLLLNLLIAIMNSCYEAVKTNVNSVLLYEKSRIILDIQALWLPFVAWGHGRPRSYYFPRWLFILAPAADADTWTALD